MTTYDLLKIGGTTYSDKVQTQIVRSMSDDNLSSVFDITLNNNYGKYSSAFSVGQVVQVYAASGVMPAGTGSPFFEGVVEEISFSGDGRPSSEHVRLSGRDYTALLQNVTVEPTVFTNLEVGSIVKSLVAAEAPSITVNNVQNTGYTVPRIRFSHTSLYDALRQLADIAGEWYFYVDVSKDLNFKPLNTTSTGFTFKSNDNITYSTVNEVNREMINQIWVYGDRTLAAAPRKTYTANGGSVYSLDYKPHNTAVFVGGSTASKVGGVFNFVGQGDPGSPFQYLVNYEGSGIVFVSGTSAGNNIPISGTDTIIIDYQRSVPVTKYGQDDASVDLYGPREDWIVDRNIKDPRQATELVLATLDKKAFPVKSVTVEPFGFFDVTPGQTAGVYIPYQNVSGAAYNIVQATYTFNKQNNLSDQTLSLTLNKKLVDGIDKIKSMIIEIERLKAQELDPNELYTRLNVAIGSAGTRVRTWTANTRTLGSSFVLGHPTLGKLGTSLTPQPYLGDSRSALAFAVSGGEL